MGAESFRQQLRTLIEQGGWKVPGLAIKAGYNRSYLWEVLNGRKKPSRELVIDLDTALGANGTLTHVWEEQESADVNRRDLLRGVTGAALAGPLAADAKRAARFARRIADGETGPLTLDQLEADAINLARRYVCEPMNALVDDLRDLTDDVFSLIELNKMPNQLRTLHLIASRLCGLHAHLCLDLGFYPEADTQARAALQIAKAAGHQGQYAWVRSLQGLIAYWDGRPAETMSLAADGMPHAADRSTAIRLPALQARAAAQLGDSRAALAALAAADDARSGSLAEDPTGGVFSFPEAKHATYAGTTLRVLPGFADQAVSESVRALQIYTSSPAELQSTGDILAAHLDLACAYLASDDLDATNAHLATVFAAAPDRRTASLRKRANALAADMTSPRYSTTPLGAQLRGALNAFAAEPEAITAQ